VADALGAVLPSTAELVVVAILVAVTVAIPLALMSAVRAKGAGDAVRRVLVIVAAGMPVFWLALLLQSLISVQWKLLPISGVNTLGIQIPPVTGLRLVDSLIIGSPIAFWDTLTHLILPAVILAVPFTGQLYRVIRAELLRVMAREHIQVARSTGISGRRLLWGHALPQVVNPALLMVGVEFATLFGGAILVESVFGRSGFGSFMTNAVAQKDTSSVLGGVIVIGVIVVATSLIVDTIQIIRDPRVRAQQLGRRS
jgi:peptide/nickel transport system permease protein